MPPGLEVTVPRPIPVFVTDSVKRFSMKIAVTDRTFTIVTVHVAPDSESQPVQPLKVELAAEAAVSVTCELLKNDALHVDGQLIPAGEDDTAPEPSPCRTTASDTMSATVIAVLPV